MEQCVHHWLRPAATLRIPPGEESAHHQAQAGFCLPAVVADAHRQGAVTLWALPIVVPTTCGPMEQSDGVAAASGAVPLTCRRTFQFSPGGEPEVSMDHSEGGAVRSVDGHAPLTIRAGEGAAAAALSAPASRAPPGGWTGPWWRRHCHPRRRPAEAAAGRPAGDNSRSGKSLSATRTTGAAPVCTHFPVAQGRCRCRRWLHGCCPWGR